MMRPWHIPRRTVLRGLGAALALALLEAMSPASLFGDEPSPRAAKEPRFKPPRSAVRMVVMNLPCGTYHQEWEPTKAGPLGELTPMLKPLQAYADDLLVLSNLWHLAATADPIAHYANEACFLTGMPVKKTDGADLSVNGVSMDQIAARCTGTLTRFPSLHLGMQKPVGGGDTGWARMYNNQLSWSTPTTPVPNEIDPRRAFDRLFRTPGEASAGGPAVAMALSDEDKKSVLDQVQADAASLKQKLGVVDQRKLDEYLTSVRDVEAQLDRELKAQAKERRVDPAAKRAVGQLGGMVVAFDGRDDTKRLRLMLDILTLALWTDSTRVATFMFGHERNDINYSFIDGVSGTHHEISHYTESPDKLRQYRLINLWHAEQVAYLLGRMKAITEANGQTLLDNSLVLWGSTLSDGNTHARDNLPITLAGRGGGAIKPGRHLVLPKNTPLSNLFLAMMQCLGVQVDSFADSTGPLVELVQG